MLTEGIGPRVKINVLSDALVLVGFEVTLYGRFWVIPEDLDYGGIRRIFALVLGSNNHLYAREWNSWNQQWSWFDFGSSPNLPIAGAPAAVAYTDEYGI